MTSSYNIFHKWPTTMKSLKLTQNHISKIWMFFSLFFYCFASSPLNPTSCKRLFFTSFALNERPVECVISAIFIWNVDEMIISALALPKMMMKKKHTFSEIKIALLFQRLKFISNISWISLLLRFARHAFTLTICRKIRAKFPASSFSTEQFAISFLYEYLWWQFGLFFFANLWANRHCEKCFFSCASVYYIMPKPKIKMP